MLTGLFSFLKDLPKAHNIISEKKQEIHDVNFVQMRLQQVLSKCLFEFEEEFDFEFSHKKKSLSYVLDLGIDRDPDFSGPVMANLFLDTKKNFKIDYLSLQNSKKKRSETLIENIERIDFYFFEMDSKKWTKNKIIENNTLPRMIKIEMQKNGEKIEFAYIFSHNEPIMVNI